MEKTIAFCLKKVFLITGNIIYQGNIPMLWKVHSVNICCIFNESQAVKYWKMKTEKCH